MNGSNIVTNVKELATSIEEMRCLTRNYGGVDFLCMGDRLHGAFPNFIWKLIHSPSCGLYILMGGSNSFPQK